MKLSTCGGIVSYNCTYLQSVDRTPTTVLTNRSCARNPDYPSTYVGGGDSCSWSLKKTSSDVCMIRSHDTDVMMM